MARQGVFENALSTFCKGALEALWHARTNFGIDKDTSNCFLAIAAFETEVLRFRKPMRTSGRGTSVPIPKFVSIVARSYELRNR